jgi:multidrug resistance efflux pump
MKSQSVDRIPIPRAQRLRLFRREVMPTLVFATVAVVVAWLWRANVSAPTLVGQVEARQAVVSSPQAGLLTGLTVQRFERVQAGQLIGHVLVADPRLMEASLAVARAKIDALRAGAGDRPMASQQRNAMDYIRLRLDWMRQRAALASARVNLQLAEAEVVRTELLFKDKIASQVVLDQTRATRDSYREEVEELSRLVVECEASMKALSPNEGTDLVRVTDESLRAAMAVEEANLQLTEAQLRPVPMYAPIGGMVISNHFYSGETVMAGAPVVTISAERSDRIVAYLRTPAGPGLTPGATVTVRSRGTPRTSAAAQITAVGAQLEPVPEALRSTLRLTGVELGVPVSILVPQGLELRPGEVVDVMMTAVGR